MARFRVYIKPFEADGTYADDYTEITRDVISLATIAQQLDNTEYGIGVFRNTNFNIKLRNDSGAYSGVDTIKSIFRYKRSDSKVKITYDICDYDLICGFWEAGGGYLGEEVTIFEGLLTEVTSSSNIEDQAVEFKILGFESMLDRAEVPFADINDTDLISEVIYKCLNQTVITDLLMVTALNIVPEIDIAIDTKADLENQTVKEALQTLLLASNSVLYLRDNTIYVKNRAASDELMFQFYGQASNDGIENVISIKNYRDGLNRTFNYWTWEDTTLLARDNTSIQQNGVLKKEIKNDLILPSSTAKIQQMLDSNRDEFAFPKQEFEIETPITYAALDVGLLDKIAVDYPTVFTPADSNPLPRYGQSLYAGARYPFAQWSLKISKTARFKVLSKKIDPVKQIITFGVRGI